MRGPNALNSALPLSIQARTAAFDFFRRQGLVVDAGNEDLETFARKSTPEEWRRKGILFRRRAQYDVAADCFDRGNAPKEAMACRGKAHVKDALESRDRGDRGTEFRASLECAAACFLETGQLAHAEMAAKCLLDKRLDRAGTAARVLDALALYDSQRFALRAAHAYGRLGAPPADTDRAFELYWSQNKRRRALRMLVREHRFQRAIEAIQGAAVTGGHHDRATTIAGYSVRELAEEGVFHFSKRVVAAGARGDEREAAERRRDDLMQYLDPKAQLAVRGKGAGRITRRGVRTT